MLHRFTTSLIALGGLMCAGLPAQAATDTATQAATLAEIDAGRRLAVETCGACHATASEDKSPLAIAPAFRDLGKRYPVSNLEEALAEGIVTGHDDMPEVEWETDQIVAFIAYLVSIQAH